MFSVCGSVHGGGARGYPPPETKGVPPVVTPGGCFCTKGYPLVVTPEGLYQYQWGIPSGDTWWIVSVSYAAGGAPLAVTMEDCLVD